MFESRYEIANSSVDLLRCDVKLTETVNFCDTIEEENEDTRESPKEQLIDTTKKLSNKKTKNYLNFLDNRPIRKYYTNQRHTHN